MLGPFATASRRYIASHQVLLLSHASTVARHLRIDVHDDDDNNNDNGDRGDRYGLMEWAQQWINCEQLFLYNFSYKNATSTNDFDSQTQ